jgi:hypothetical protein
LKGEIWSHIFHFALRSDNEFTTDIELSIVLGKQRRDIESSIILVCKRWLKIYYCTLFKGIIMFNGYKINMSKTLYYLQIIINILKSKINNYYYHYNNGFRYEGVMKNNMREGNGVCSYFETDTKTKCIYEGDWKNNKRDGRGIEFYDCLN